MRSSCLDGQTYWVLTEKRKTQISIKKGSASSFIKRTQFLLTLRARTVFKSFWKNAGNFAVLVCCAAAK